MHPNVKTTARGRSRSAAEDRPFMVDGMVVTAAAELAPEAYDLTDYKPRHEPVTLYLAYRRTAPSPPRAQDRDAAGTAHAHDWSEELRRRLANEGKPPAIVKRLVCSKGHTLLWLLRGPSGLVPLARTVDRRFTYRGLGRPDGSAMTLQQWPAGEHLPIASCRCHHRVEISVHEAKTWFERVGGASPRDKVVYSP